MISEALEEEARRIATELANSEVETQPLREDGSRERPISGQLRERFIALRDSLYRQGHYDPILGRFDSYTVEQATLGEIAQRLREIAGENGA